MKVEVRDKLRVGMKLTPLAMNITDQDVYIHPKIQEDLEGIIACVERNALFGKEMGYSGIIFEGPAGTGKTLYAKWMAYKTNSNLIDIGLITSPDQIRDLYKGARELRTSQNKPVLLFIDEVDRVSNRDDIIDPTQATTLNQLLMELDGTQSNQGVYTLAATNKPEKIDNALRRPGRFGKEIYFYPPDEKGRYEILRIHAFNKDHEFKVKDNDLKELAKITYGYTGADLKGVLTEAFVKANKDKRKDVQFGDLQYAFKKMKPSAIRDMPFREPKIKLGDLCGYEMHKEVLKRIIDTEGNDLLLFYGPEGNGKTAFAEALAGEYGFNFIVVNASEPQDKFVGETEKTINRYLDRAKQLSPSIILFDKIDALVERKGVQSWKGSWTGLLESKLGQPLEGVTVIATVSDPTVLNDTFTGMFTHKIFFDYPTADEQIALWEKYLGNNPEIDAAELVLKNSKLSCRDITQICKRVRDFGLPQSQQVYLDVLETHQPLTNGENYEEMIKKYGDSVLEYNKIKHIIKKNEIKKDKK